jgi:hypothetical protein
MADDPRTQVLEKVYEDVVTERDRLRSAREGFTSRLGPLPASAGIVIALAGAVGKDVGDGWLILAGGLFALLVFVSIVYSGLTPYRLMRAERLSPSDRLDFWRESKDLQAWLRCKIELENDICGGLRAEQRPSLNPKVDNLQQALDVERTAFTLVQILFVDIVLVVVLGLICDGGKGVYAGAAGGVLLFTLVAVVLAAWQRPFRGKAAGGTSPPK